MREFTIDQLNEEVYLEDNGSTIAEIVDAEIMPRFESEIKRVFTLSTKEDFYFSLRGLRKSNKNPSLQRDSFRLHSKYPVAVCPQSFLTDYH